MIANPDAQPRRPIRFWLPLILGIGGCAILLLLTVFELDETKRRVEERARNDVAMIMSNLQGAITYRLRQHDRAGVQNVIANQGFHEHSKHVLFIDEQDNIVAATRLALVGTPLAAAVPELHAQLSGCKGNRWRGVIRISTDRQRLFACYPAAIPHDVSDIERQSTGSLLSSYDLNRLQRAARAQTTRRLSLVWLLFGAGYLSVLLLLRHALARRRIAQIVDTTASLAAGNLESRVGLGGRDELASIGLAVDSMAERLQSTSGELRRAHEELEERVRARTVELSKTNQKLEHEIAARLNSERALLESEKFLESVLDAQTGHLAVLDQRGTIVAVNESWRRFGAQNGLTAVDACVGLNYLECCDRVLGDDAGEAAAAAVGIRAILSGELTQFQLEYPCHSPDSLRWFVMQVTPFHDGTIQAVVVHENITARKQMELQVRESEERYRTLIDLSPDAAFVSQGGKLLYVNSAMMRLLAAPSAEALLGRSLFDFLHPDCHGIVRARMRRLDETGESNPPLLQKWICLDGSIVEVEAVAARIPWHEGPANLVMLRDVSEVQKREAWLQGLIETTQDAVISIDRKARIVMFNPAAEKLFGYSKAEVEGQKINLLMGEPYASEHDDYLARYERTGERRAIGKTRTVVARRKNGEDFPIELSVTQVATGSEVNYAAFIRDISEKTRLQSELTEKQRLAAVGATAAKFAHEIGNPLNGMYMTAQLLERRLLKLAGDDETVSSSFNRIVSEMRRLNSLLSEFRTLYREERYVFRPTSIAALIRDLLNLERPNYIGRGIRVDESVAPDLPEISADGDKLKQVLLNLCKNGVEAMPHGGVLTVRAARDGADAVIEVSDTGAGITEGVDIFQPFKTTKPAGTGLGLMIVRQIVNAHKGTITYRSTPEVGTTFTIKLPLVSQG